MLHCDFITTGNRSGYVHFQGYGMLLGSWHDEFVKIGK
jgi:hypothetical protein